MAPLHCEKKRERCQTKTTQKQSRTYRIRLRKTKSEINSHAKLRAFLLLLGYKHHKHDTRHLKTKHTTHPAPGNVSTTTHYSSRSTAAPMSSLTSPFLQRHDRRCSSLEVRNPICCCGLGSSCTFLPALRPSIFPPVPPTTCPPTSLLLA